VIDFAAEPDGQPAQHWLYRCEDRSPFAYARGHLFIRYVDHLSWARLCDDQLVSVRSGDCLAYRVGSVFFDAVSNKPVYTSSQFAPSPSVAGTGS
jgi:hypothetical protein